MYVRAPALDTKVTKSRGDPDALSEINSYILFQSMYMRITATVINKCFANAQILFPNQSGRNIEFSRMAVRLPTCGKRVLHATHLSLTVE